MLFTREVLNDAARACTGPKAATGPGGIILLLTKALLECAMKAELLHLLGYQKNSPCEKQTANRRNGMSPKTLWTDHGPIEIMIPRDRRREFAPQIVPKHLRRWLGFSAKVISIYACCATASHIYDCLKDMYPKGASHDLIARVAEEVKTLLGLLHNGKLEATYPEVYFEELISASDESGGPYSVFMAMAVREDGKRQLLGIWKQQRIAGQEGQESQGADFWLGVLNQLKARGAINIQKAVGRMGGFTEAMAAAYQ